MARWRLRAVPKSRNDPRLAKETRDMKIRSRWNRAVAVAATMLFGAGALVPASAAAQSTLSEGIARRARNASVPMN